MTSKEFEIFDSHHHIWSNGEEKYPWVVEPIDELKENSTIESYIASTNSESSNRVRIEASNEHEIKITKSLIVQPLNHKFDHSYLFHALKSYPDKFFGMGLANPDEGVIGLRQLKEAGPKNFVGVRFNPALFPGGNMESELAGDMFEEASNLNLVVGVMCFKGIKDHVPALSKWAAKNENLKIIIDHMGFFRQPAVGAVVDTNDIIHNDEQHWNALLSLSNFKNVYVKISALFRLSGEPFPHNDLVKDERIATLIQKFGAERLMWGSDWPYVMTGNQMGMSDFAVKSLIEACRVFQRWNEKEQKFSDEVIHKIMFQTSSDTFKVQ